MRRKLLRNGVNAEVIGTKFYNNAIQTWTDRDVNKRNVAKKNKLNYLVFYSILEIGKWIKDGKDK